MSDACIQEKLRQLFGDYDRTKPYDIIYVTSYEVVCPHIESSSIDYSASTKIPEYAEIKKSRVTLKKNKLW